MKETSRFVARLLCLALTLQCHIGMAQQCSREAITAKYWQYRKNFNQHFMMNDRKPEGCIGNGITRNEGDLSQLSCGTQLLHGYGLPATSIVMAPNGGAHWRGMDNRNDSDDTDFFNPKCANGGPSPGTSWNPPGSPNFDPTSDPTEDHHNILEYGSETPHQIGWYLVTLATEYALLGQNGQLEEQQRTLEDLFLALQSYRRLDITANCLVKDRYDEITAGFETEDCDIWVGNHHYTEDACLCAEKYHNDQCKGSIGDAKWHFDIPCKTNCPWSPDLSGFSGFFIREDAVQEQEGLHDDSEDRWNIDLVGNAFAMSQSPPCEPNFSPTCYNEKKTNFLSIDQMFSILMGLAMVKRYIPPTATVTTCDGTVYNPFNIVQEIANGLVKLPQNTTRHIFWPGSSDDDCCYKAVKFGECAGGNFQWHYAGIEYMYNYINEGDDDHKIGMFDRWKWFKLTDRTFYATAMSIGFDIGTYGSDNAKQRIINACMDDKMEILLLMNDLLHPAPPNLMDDEDQDELKNRFEQMLCNAPCDGACFKPEGYDNLGNDWPEFDCANTPDWIGQRWEGYGYPPPNQAAWDARDPRQYNGLDFMALYNTYMLNFPEEQTPYYNPDRPESISFGNALGENMIEGPTTLCPGQSGSYKALHVYDYAAINPLLWSGSSNITFSSTTSNPTSATIVTALTPTYIEAKFSQNKGASQYYNGLVQKTEGYVTADPPHVYVPPHPIIIQDVCDFSFQKPIITQAPPDYQIVPDVVPCQFRYWVRANGPQVPEDNISWEATNDSPPLFDHATYMDGSGSFFNFGNLIPPSHHNRHGTVNIKLTINTDCGDLIRTLDYDYITCPLLPPGMTISPNPGQNLIAIRITQDETEDFVSTDPNGVRIRIYPASGGTTALMDTYLYSNGQYFNVSSLPNGVYQVSAIASDLTPIQANLSIVR